MMVRITLLALLLCGCSGKSPETRYYLLSDPTRSVPPASEFCGAELASVAVAPYLQRTHIVLQRGGNELVPALQHRWSEPLDAGVARLLRQCLSSGADARHRVRVLIDHLHGTDAGEVMLQASWTVAGEDSSTHQYGAREAQRAAGYDALVSTQRDLVLSLCAEIRSSLPDCGLAR